MLWTNVPSYCARVFCISLTLNIKHIPCEFSKLKTFKLQFRTCLFLFKLCPTFGFVLFIIDRLVYLPLCFRDVVSKAQLHKVDWFVVGHIHRLLIWQGFIYVNSIILYNELYVRLKVNSAVEDGGHAAASNTVHQHNVRW